MADPQHSYFSHCRAKAGVCMSTDILVEAFIIDLRRTRGPGMFWSHKGAARHFLFWLGRSRIPLTGVNDAVVDRFARHRCRCPRYSPNALKDSVYHSRVRHFVRFLEDRGDIPVADDLETVASYIAEFANDLKTIGYSLVTQQT